MNAPKHLIIALLVTGCGGGSWSNKDLEFLAALPDKEALRAKLPESGSSQGGLRRDGLHGESAVGHPSKLYADTRRGATDLNRLLDAILTVVEHVKSLPPSRREGDHRRVWGPWPDQNNPGFDVRLIMDRALDVYEYRIELTPSGKDEWFSVLDGSYQASREIKKGAGTVTFKAAASREHGLDKESDLDFIAITYNTDSDPIVVLVTARNALGATFDFESHTYSDGRGWIHFQASGIDEGSGQHLTFDARSIWLPSGEGRGHFRVLEPAAYASARHAECWDDQFLTTWFEQTWNGKQGGTPSEACAALESLLR